ncbi:MAG: hypothetical protein U9R74_01290 [Pseudomonadota bacterium]|nr:hypothetical protein [Pseudomonadota bacterium]
MRAVSTKGTLEEPAAAVDSIKQACFAIIWLKNDGQSFDERVIMDELGSHDGVISARFSRRDPMMMMVEYDSNRTRTRHILDWVNGAGAVAQLVGC